MQQKKTICSRII